MCVHACTHVAAPPTKMIVEYILQTTDDVIVGQTRDCVNEFVYDYSYWSLDSTAINYTSQEQVGSTCTVM